ncbi:MAG: MFS transporter [Alphaproteobacteria bacterium]|nr:MFS transporter [Alphaproteobacteria bacterium]
MYATIVSCWTLLLGMSLLMLGNGLQGSLLGIRATIEGFPTAVTGFVMSGYYLGFLAGSTVAPVVVKRVGHVRVFAALASIASASALVHAVFVDPAVWTAMRIVTGFAYAGLYVVAESWLNATGTNQNRGQLLSIYMVCMLGGLACGQFLLTVADPGGFVLFILVSVLVSLSMVPISLTAVTAPSYDAPDPVGLIGLYRISPLGVIGCLGVGVGQGAFYGMGAVYGEEMNFPVSAIALFMGLFTVGGVVLQWPIGRLSDQFDRRIVLTVATFLAAAAALGAMALAARDGLPFFTLVFLFGGMSLPMYSLCIAHTNDYLDAKQIVAASGSLVLVTGAGAVLGPLTVSAMMSVAGAPAFLWSIAVVHVLIGLFALYRMTRRPSVALEDRLPGLDLPMRTTALAAAMAMEASQDEADEQRDAT